MARANNKKYTPINFNHILEKTNPISSSPSPSLTKPLNSSSYQSYSSVSSRNGRMLILTRPASKPISGSTQPSPQSTSVAQQTNQTTRPADPDPISLRPLGSNGAAPVAKCPVQSPDKPNKFVPPHLRPGFVGREERLGPEMGLVRVREPGQRYFGSPSRVGSDGGRPRSGGYERGGRGGESDLGPAGWAGSGWNRPSSSGW